MCEYTEIEALLLTALALSPNSVKDIATATNIKPSRLYKWRTTSGHLSQSKQEALMLYFMKNEPDILILALIVKTITNILLL